MLTYAQNFEDVMLARLFREQSSGFYIDIGAWDPIELSVTKHFYDLGWFGINVEPVRKQYELFAASRPRDLNMCVAAAERKGTLRLHECVNYTALSTIDDAQAAGLARNGNTITSYDVDALTLTEIAACCPGRTVDFLKIDVEGSEGRIVRSTDWRTFRPRVLVIEGSRPAGGLIDWDSADATAGWDTWEPVLLTSGYMRAWDDGLNRFYLRDEDAHLAPRLKFPPGVYDQLQFPQVDRLNREIAEIRSERDWLAREVKELRQDRARLILDTEALGKDRDMLVRDSEALRNDRDRLLGDGEALRNDRDRLVHDTESLRKDRDRLVEDTEALHRDRDRLAQDAEALRSARDQRDEEIRKLISAIGTERHASESTIERLQRDLEGKETTIDELNLASKANTTPRADDAQPGQDAEMPIARKGKSLPLRLAALVNRLRPSESSPWRVRQIVVRTKRLVRAVVGYRLGQFQMYAPKKLALPAQYKKPHGASGKLRISIVTPVYNQARFIGETIDSILSQNYQALEYIVMDGGSTDGSAEVVERHRPSLARFESARDTGQANAINKGMSYASGDVLAWLNGDDLLLPGAIEYVAYFFEQNPDVDVVYGHRVIIDSQSLDIGRWILPPHDDEVLSWADYVPQETLFWRRRIWERVGARMDESFQFALDWDLLVRFRDAGARFKRLPRFLGAFRVHPEQKTTKEIGTKGAVEMDRIRLRCIGYLPSYLEINRKIAPYMLRHAALHNFNGLYRLY